MVALVSEVKLMDCAEIKRLKATLNRTRSRLMIRMFTERMFFFIPLLKYNMRAAYAYVLDSSFAV